MPVIRTFISKAKPGRMQDAVTAAATLKRLSMEAGAHAFAAYNIITGPLFPGFTTHIVSEDLAAFGAVRDKVLAHPEAAQFFAADAPFDTMNALLVEPVYRAGPPIADIVAQMTVRFSYVIKPHRGRADDVVRRLSRVADTAHQCGALTVAVRSVIAGSEGPRIGIHTYHAGFAEWQATRAAVRESDVWTAVNRSQDDIGTHMMSVVSTKLDI